MAKSEVKETKSVYALKAEDEFSFEHLREKIRGLKDAQAGVRDELDRQRDRRYFDGFNIGNSMKSSGQLDADAFLISSRLIDINIRREAPEFSKYLTKPNRTLVIDTYDADTPMPAIEITEKDFTRKARYPNWQQPWLKAVDCAQAYGYGLLRVDFDEDEPGHFRIEYVNRRNMLFNDACHDIESQAYIGEIVPMSGYELYRAVQDNDFDAEVVDALVSNKQSGLDVVDASDNSYSNQLIGRLDKMYDVYKIHYKDNDCVYVCWLTLNGDTKWLSKPVKLWHGKFDVLEMMSNVDKAFNEEGEIADKFMIYESSFPYVVIKYTEDEAEALDEIRGRCDLDQGDQEACTALLTSQVKAAIRSTYIQAAPAKGPVDINPGVAQPKQTDVKVMDGKVWTSAMQFFYLPAPSETASNMYLTLLNKNQSEQTKPEFAVKNREDSRKTATELKLAAKEGAELASLQMLLFSIAYLNAYGKCFEIYRNRVLAGQLELSERFKEAILSVLGNKLVLRPAGDIDVLERERLLLKQMEFWPVISPTAAGVEFLKDMLRSAFPEDAEKYVELLNQDQKKNEMIQQLLQMIASSPEAQANPDMMKQLEEQVGQVITQQGTTSAS